MRDRLLIRHFLWRFLEHDLVSPTSDRRSVLSAVVGLLFALSLFLAIYVAVPYAFTNVMPPGVVSLRSLDDRFLFVSVSMLVMALAAVGQWDALTLDARDAAVLGTLPVPRWVMVRSKLAATGLFACVVLVAWNALPTLLRAAAVPSGVRLGWLGNVHLTVAHAATSCASGLFGFLFVFSVRETACALLGPARFKRVSAPLQAMLVMSLVTALLLLPYSAPIGRRWSGPEGAAVRMLPPLWFVGLHETLAGSVIDSLPRAAPARHLLREEETSTALYRSLRPEFPKSARVALAALLAVAVAAVVACLWNSRRLPDGAARSQAGRTIVGLAWEKVTSGVAAGTPPQQAGFCFALQAMSRCAANRMTIAAAVAVALSLMIVAGFRPAVGDVASIPLTTLATQSIAVGTLLIAFRRITRLPADLRAGLTFELAWQGAAAPFIAGVKRAAWVAVVLPALFLMAVWHISILGPRLTLAHLGVGAALGIFAMESLFFRTRRVPFSSAYVPSQDAKVVGIVYFGLLLNASLVVALVERSSFDLPWLYVGMLATLAVLSVCLKHFDRVSALATIELDPDEDASLPTQRLSLNR